MNNQSDNAHRGAQALAALAIQDVGSTPNGLFEQVINDVTQPVSEQHDSRQFWYGTGFGAAIAASIFMFAMTLDLWGGSTTTDTGALHFQIAVNEPRSMDIAIETDRALTGATISVILAGGVELDGYAGRRDLTWTEDLDAGVNRLTLPLVATGSEGGQLLVRLSHPQSEQVFVINLETDA